MFIVNILFASQLTNNLIIIVTSFNRQHKDTKHSLDQSTVQRDTLNILEKMKTKKKKRKEKRLTNLMWTQEEGSARRQDVKFHVKTRYMKTAREANLAANDKLL